jgi:hypothetical protein
MDDSRLVAMLDEVERTLAASHHDGQLRAARRLRARAARAPLMARASSPGAASRPRVAAVRVQFSLRAKALEAISNFCRRGA